MKCLFLQGIERNYYANVYYEELKLKNEWTKWR
jgi:hypothetical protein